MVHIINGEIVADDDPRVKARLQGGSAGTGPAQRRSAGGIAGIAGLGGASQPAPVGGPPNGGAPPSPLQGLAQKFGLEGTVLIPAFLGLSARPIEKVYLVIAALLVYFFGWRALVFLSFAFYLSTQQPAATAPVAGGAPPRHGGPGGPAATGVGRL